MKTIETTLTTTALFSKDETKRYLLKKIWDANKPSLGIVMLVPSDASGIVLDSTTMLVLNNASRLGYGSVSIVNLFATLGDHRLAHAEDEDTENINAIIDVAKTVDTMVYAPGVGKGTNKSFIKRQTQVLKALAPYESKMRCISNSNGIARFQHPLSPVVRVWHLSEMRVAELLDSATVKLIEAQGEHSKKTKK